MKFTLLIILQSISSLIFAPQEGLVKDVEKPYRDEICLNGLWDFQAVDVPGDFVQGSGIAPQIASPDKNGWESTKIRIPSPWNANAYCSEATLGPDHVSFPSYPEKWNTVRMAWMRRTAHIPESWKGKSIRLHFEAVAGRCVVLVNGKRLGENLDPFLPFEVCLDSTASAGEDIEILVGVRSESLFEDSTGRPGSRKVPTGSTWGYAICGIWQDVYLEAVPEVCIEDVFVKPLVGRGLLQMDVKVRNNSLRARPFSVKGSVREWVNLADSTPVHAPEPLWKLGDEALSVPLHNNRIKPGETVEMSLTIPVPEGTLRYWTPEDPNLYAVLLTLESGLQNTDLKYERFGWRQWTIKGGRHCLNGEPYELRGDAWHFQGIPQMTRRYAWAWYRMLKDANCNAVRPHAIIYPRFYMDMADEMGICVLDETGNWGSGGGYAYNSSEFWVNSEDPLRRFVLRDRNHASVFGWSICNENINIIDASNCWDVLPYQEKAWKEWRDIVLDLDGTRAWISADGEDDGSARFYIAEDETGKLRSYSCEKEYVETGPLPVVVGHYGDAAQMRKWAGTGKPWGIGEQSMAYYGSPAEASRYNGDRAFESVLGRMEALAAQSYELLTLQRKMGASYSSVFNIVWYALQPLPLGGGSGIVFGGFQEGRPGVQPERLGPWCTTLNPGYDPSLPLYKPWPMFDAVRSANNPSGPEPSVWAEPEIVILEPSDDVIHYDRVIYVGSSGSALESLLRRAGVPVSTVGEIHPGETVIYIVDASCELPEEFRDVLRGASDSGSTIWLWGINPSSIHSFAGLIPGNLEFDSLKRSSFIPNQVSWTKGLGSSDFYFCESQKEDACSYTMKGALVDEGTVLLSACRTDWRLWNGQSETSKTVSVLRSELECNAALPAFVKCGNLFLSTLDNFAGTKRGMQTLCKLLSSAGIPFSDREVSGGVAVKLDDSSLSVVISGRNSAKIFSRRDLRDLLIEPDIPRLALKISPAASEIKVNGVAVAATDDGLFHDLPFSQGWNALEIGSSAGGDYTLEFICTNKPDYLKSLEITTNL